MDHADRLRQLGIGLAQLLDENQRAAALRAFDSQADDALTALESLVDRLQAREKRREALLRERGFQLELALAILSTRERAAAEQAEWDFATDLQLAGLPQDFPAFPDRNDFDLHAGMVTA